MESQRKKAKKPEEGNNIPQKLPAHKNPEFFFKPGIAANPAGRPKGSRNKFAEVFLKDFLADWETAGIHAIQRCRLENPAGYLRVAASILPKELNLTDEDSVFEKLLEQFSIEQLDQLLVGIAAIGLAEKSKHSKAKAIAGSQSDSIQ